MAQTQKLSVSTVFGKIKTEHYSEVVDGKIAPRAKPYWVARFGGMCVNSKLVPVPAYPDKPATAFLGDFVGINPVTGEQLMASTLYLPEIAQTWVSVQLARPEVRGVQFLIDVFVSPTSNVRPGALPYMYTFQHVMPPDESDPITKMLAAAQGVKPIPLLQLPSHASLPAGAPAPEPEPAPAPAVDINSPELAASPVAQENAKSWPTSKKGK